MTAASLRKGHLRDRCLPPITGLLQRRSEVADGTLIAALAAELFEWPLDRIAVDHLRRELDRQPLHGRGEIGVRHLRHTRRAKGEARDQQRGEAGASAFDLRTAHSPPILSELPCRRQAHPPGAPCVLTLSE